jgi:hypothetical protein
MIKDQRRIEKEEKRRAAVVYLKFTISALSQWPNEI